MIRVLLALSLLALGAVAGCAVMLPVVPARPTGDAARPPVLAARGSDPAVTTAAAWSTQRVPLLKRAFEDAVYGRVPPPVPVRVVSRAALEPVKAVPGATFEVMTLAFGADDGAPRATVVLAVPKAAGQRHATVILQNFCGNRAAVPGHPLAAASLGVVPDPCNGTITGGIIRAVFGQYANAPPWGDLIARGYAVAIIYAGDVVPDDAAAARPVLARLGALPEPTPAVTPSRAPTGAIAAWAWVYSRVIDVLTTDPRLDPARMAVWGHSRNGKAALLAAATDRRIALVIAHQSGRGGAALSRSPVGESVGQITAGYPHWFTPAYAQFAGRENALPVDQHELIAMIAPRPVLLGQGQQDQWADPASSFRALEAASPAYALFGVPGLVQSGMHAPDVRANLAYFMRPGRHGVSTQDWRYFLAFLDAHLPDPSAKSD